MSIHSIPCPVLSGAVPIEFRRTCLRVHDDEEKDERGDNEQEYAAHTPVVGRRK